MTDRFNITCDVTLRHPIQQNIHAMFHKDTQSMFNALEKNTNYFKQTNENFETQVKMQGS